MSRSSAPLAALSNATLERNGRVLWSDVSAMVHRGEFVAVLGSNGAGKTSLLKVLLGLLPLSSGVSAVLGRAPHKGNPDIGYIPQQKSFDPMLPVTGRDLVGFGIDGYTFGVHGINKKKRAQVDAALEAVGAIDFASLPIGRLSGGQQQRLRIAQAIVGKPSLLLCDEPLLSLDLASQQKVTRLIHDYRVAENAGIIFVTHEINPILPWVDRVLYFANGNWMIDTPDKVLTSESLSKLYNTEVEVVKLKGHVIVTGVETSEVLGGPSAHHGEHA